MPLEPEGELSEEAIDVVRSWAASLGSKSDDVSDEALVLFASGLLSERERDALVDALLHSKDLRNRLGGIAASLNNAATITPKPGPVQGVISKLLASIPDLRLRTPATALLLSGWAARAQTMSMLRPVAAVRGSGVRLKLEESDSETAFMIDKAAVRRWMDQTRLYLEEIEGGKLRADAQLPDASFNRQRIWLDAGVGVPIADSVVQGSSATFEFTLTHELKEIVAVGPYAFQLRMVDEPPTLQRIQVLPIQIEPDSAAFMIIGSASIQDSKLLLFLRPEGDFFTVHSSKALEFFLQLGSMPIKLGDIPIAQLAQNGVQVSIEVPPGLDADMVIAVLSGRIPADDISKL